MFLRGTVGVGKELRDSKKVRASADGCVSACALIAEFVRD